MEIERDDYPLRDASFKTAPYQRHSPTSCEAARLIAPRLGPMEREILSVFANEIGWTDDELIQRLDTQSARPRRIFLTKIGKLRDSGTTRKTRSDRRAVVWVLA